MKIKLLTKLVGCFALLLFIVNSGAAFGLVACEPTVWPLTAGQTIDVGTVTVTNDESGLSITYDLSYPGATFPEEIQMWAGTDQMLVPSFPNRPLPGQFCQVDGGACSGAGDRPSAMRVATINDGQAFTVVDGAKRKAKSLAMGR